MVHKKNNSIKVSNISKNKKSSLRTAKNKSSFFIVAIFCMVLCFSMISAWTDQAFIKDEIKSSGTTTNYGKYIIEESKWYDPLKIWTKEKTKELELTSNTDSCGQDCSATQTITLHKKGSLIDDKRFYRIMEDGSYELSDIRNSYFLIKTNEEEYSVDDYENVCSENGKHSNGTIKYKCEYKKVGSHIEKKPLWERYEMGTELDKGIYEIKLVGEKRSSWSYDWQVKSQGVWTEEWAIWGNTTLSPADVIAYYALNETSGVVKDMTGNYDATNNGATRGVAGKINNSFTFASGNYVEYADFPNVTDEITACAWLKFTSASNMYIVGRWTGGDEQFLIYATGGNLNFNINGAFGTKTTPAVSGYDDNAWHLVCGIANSTNVILNIDSTNITIGSTYSGSLDASNQPFRLGEPSGAITYIGSMDEVSIWNRSLTKDEIIQLYNGGNGLPYNNFSEGKVTLNSPADEYISPSNEVQFNCSAQVSGGATLTNISLWTNESGTWEVKNTTTVTGTTNSTTWNRTFTDGRYKWSCSAGDSDGVTGYSTENRTLLIDSTEPTISIVSPETQINTHILGTNLELNVTITDTNLDTCWYDYNNINTTYSCSSGLQQNETFTSVAGKQTINVWANDSAGNKNYETRNWHYMILQNDTSYNSATTETSSETFILIGNKNSTIYSITAYLWYDGTPYLSTTTTGGNNFNLSNTINIPTGPAGNKSFFWEITAVGTLGTINVNTSSLNQTVSNLSIGICSGPSPKGLTLNFTTYDSGTDDIMNASLEGTFEYYAGGGGSVIEEYTYSSIDENKSNWMFCINSSGLNVTLDATISYYAENYDRREYLFDDATIGNFTQNIPLYLAATADTDVVTIIVRDQNYNDLAGAVVSIQEWNVGTNTYSTIGMFTTSSEGSGIINLELYNIWYRASVIYEGVLVEVTDVQKLSDTTWIISVELGEDNPYDLYDTISHGLTFDNSTNITTFSWADSSGYVQQGCLKVQNSTTLGLVTIYEDCTSSVSGTINYQLVGDGTYMITGTIDLIPTYNVSQIVDTLSVQLGVPDLKLTISPFGKVLSFIFIGTAAFVGISASSPVWGIFLLMSSIYFASSLGWLNITEGIFWGLLSIAMIILFRLSRRGS